MEPHSDVELVLPSKLHHVLVRTNAASLKRLAGQLLVLIGDQVHTHWEELHWSLLGSQVKDPDLRILFVEEEAVVVEEEEAAKVVVVEEEEELRKRGRGQGVFRSNMNTFPHLALLYKILTWGMACFYSIYNWRREKVGHSLLHVLPALLTIWLVFGPWLTEIWSSSTAAVHG